MRTVVTFLSLLISLYAKELILINEQPFTALTQKQKPYEASGIIYAKEHFYVVFDNKSRVAVVDKHLKTLAWRGEKIKKLGFEGITYRPDQKRFYLIEESVEDTKPLQSRVTRYEENFSLKSRHWLEAAFKKPNKGFEGVTEFYDGSDFYLLALAEATGVISLYKETAQGFQLFKSISHPKSADFLDYSGMDLRPDGTIALVSQSSAALWIGHLETQTWQFSSQGTIYTFPNNKHDEISYCYIEGVTWISDTELAMVSDMKKKKSPQRCKEKSASIHLFRVP